MQVGDKVEIYDEVTGELLQNPDLSAGYLYKGTRISVHHDEVPPVIETGVLSGTESCNDGKGLRGPIVIEPGIPAWDEYEDCQYYHKFTKEELASMNSKGDVTWEELAKAYNEGVLSIGE